MNKKLFAVLFVILAVLLFVSWSRDKENPSAELQPLKQAVKSAELTAGRAESDYVRLRDKNIALEKGAAKNAVKTLSKDYCGDTDAVFAFSQLVSRAREYSRRQLDSQH